MEHESENPAQANDDLGIGALDMNVLLGQVRRQVLGAAQPVRVGRFELLRRLGAGAMGVVYLARDPELDRDVAIKHLHPQLAKSESVELAEERMQREARAMARLSHPNVVAVYEFGSDGSQLFIAMEYIEGRTLREWLDAADERTWEQALAVMVGAGEGLAAAHAVGLVHRDFKPQNVLLGESGAVKVSDFGLASAVGQFAQFEVTRNDNLDSKGLDEMQLACSATGVVLGTPAYMAPECHAGQPADVRSDQFSFCVALYEALFGQRPFAGVGYAELAAAVRSGEIRPRPRRSSVPAWIVTVLERGLAVAPEQRWPSMDALLAALRDDPRRRRRRRLGLGVIGLSLAGLVGTFGVRHYNEQELRSSCKAKGEAIREQWGPTVRARIEASFAGAQEAYVPRIVEQVGVDLDDYTARWSRAREGLCLSHELERSWEPVLAHQAELCLETNRAWMALLIDAFEGAQTPGFIMISYDLGALPGLGVCLDPAYLRGLPELPATLEPQLRELNFALEQIELLGLLHRFDEAIEQSRQVQVQARELDWPPLVARAGLSLGVSLMRTRQTPEARRVVENAYFMALEGNALPTAIRSATILAELSGPRASVEAQQWMRHAYAALARLERPAPELRDGLDQQAMVLATRRGEFGRAIQLGEALLERLRSRFGEDHPQTVWAIFSLAMSYHGEGRSAEAKPMFERALQLDSPIDGVHGSTHTHILLGLAEVEVELGNQERGCELYEQALAARTEQEGGSAPGVAVVLANLGQLYLDMGQLDRAQAVFERMLSSHTTSPGPGQRVPSRALNALAEIALARGDQEAALAYYEANMSQQLEARGLAVYDEVLELRRRGSEKRAAGELEAALSLYAEADELRRALPRLDEGNRPKGPGSQGPGQPGGPARGGGPGSGNRRRGPLGAGYPARPPPPPRPPSAGLND